MMEFLKIFLASATDLPAGTRNNYRDVSDNSMLDPSNRLMDRDSETFAIHAAQNGSEWAWRQLFERHSDVVYRFCVELAGSRYGLAEELAQQVFVTAALRIHRFDPSRANFRAWLLGIVRNRHMVIPKHAFDEKPLQTLNTWVHLHVLDQGVYVLETLKPVEEFWATWRFKSLGLLSERKALDFVRDRLQDEDYLPIW